MTLPEPEQLREWANEPIPFHPITLEDYEISDDRSEIIIKCDNVEYVYEYAYAHELLEHESTVDISAKEAYDDCIEWYFEGGDFIGTSGYEYEAVWLLEQIVINR